MRLILKEGLSTLGLAGQLEVKAVLAQGKLHYPHYCHSKHLLYTQPSIPEVQVNRLPEAAIFASICNIDILKTSKLSQRTLESASAVRLILREGLSALVLTATPAAPRAGQLGVKAVPARGKLRHAHYTMVETSKLCPKIMIYFCLQNQ